ncbi:MAG: MBL fold metallo-hydrolase [Steroidobacteraceae bacterium]
MRRTILRAALLLAYAPLTVQLGLAQSAGQEHNSARPLSTASTQAGQSGTRLILLGTAGGPEMRKCRSQPSSLLVVHGRPYLIDAGAGVVHQLVAAGFAPRDIHTIFLTHLHMDHTEGLAALIAFTWSGTWGATGREPIGIYGPPGTELLARYADQYNSISAAIFRPEVPTPVPLTQLFHAHDLHLSGPTLVYHDADVRVFAVPNTHYITMKLPRRPYGFDQSYAYRFETRDRTVVFTGDTGWSDAVAQLARNADILVTEVLLTKRVVAGIERRRTSHPAATRALIRHMELEHLSPGEVGKLASRAHVKMVVLTHIVQGAGCETDATPYVSGVKRYYSGPVVLGRDLDRF